MIVLSKNGITQDRYRLIAKSLEDLAFTCKSAAAASERRWTSSVLNKYKYVQ